MLVLLLAGPLGAQEPVYEVRAQGDLRAGFGEADITPDWPVRLAYGRPEPTTGVYDRTMVKALLLEVDTVTTVLLEYDVIGIRRADAELIKAEIGRATGLDPRHVIVAATHNHSYARTNDERIRSLLASRGVDAVRQAQAGIFDARIGVGKTRAREDLNLNRAELDGLANPLLYVMRVEDAAGHLRGLMYNYGSHATIFTEWADVGQTGPDWPGYVSKYVQSRVELDLLYERYDAKDDRPTRPFVMYSGGAAGDQQPRRSDVMLAGRQAPPKKVFMEKLAAEVLGLLEDVETERRVELAFRSRAVELPRKNGGRHETVLQALVLNDAVLATIPGELGVDLAYQFEAGSPLEKNVLLTNADDYIGYIVPEHLALEAVTYQAKGVGFAPHYGVQIIDEALRLIDPAHADTPPLDPARLLGRISGTVDYGGDKVIAVGVRRIPDGPNYGGGFWGQRTLADEHGRWEIDDLAPGIFYVYVAEADPGNPGPERMKSGYRDLRLLTYGRPATVEAGRETRNVNFALPADLLETDVTGLELVERSVSLDGSTLAGAFRVEGALAADETVQVGLHPADLTYRKLERFLARPVLQTRAGPDGAFRFESVPPGRYRIVALLDVNRNQLVEPKVDVVSRLAGSPVVTVPAALEVP